MTLVGVIAHQGKTLGAGLGELDWHLRERGLDDVKWYRIRKSKHAPDAAREALRDGVDLALIWGGDGTAQRCLDVFAGSAVRVGLLPAGTANLLASNLGIPAALPDALDIALTGSQQRIDVGVINGERFGIMAGAGVDGVSMQKTDGPLKERLGKFAYVWTGMKAARISAPRATVKVDGQRWFKGDASCLLFGNMGSLGVGLQAFPRARPDDGILEIGVVTAEGVAQWLRVASWILLGHPERSRFVQTTRGTSATVKFDRAMPYQLDGGTRRAARRLQVSIEPLAVTICVPASEPDVDPRRRDAASLSITSARLWAQGKYKHL